jgi:hypothetical protein
MNSIPKQQEGDAADAAAASGARSGLEQTVLGVAPTTAAPSEQAGSHTAAAGASPSEPNAHSTPDEPPSVVITPVIVAAPMIAVSSSTPAEPAEPSVVAAAVTSAPATVDDAPPRALPAELEAPVPLAPERSSATPPYGTPAAGGGAEGQPGTVLNADYLRVAREVAFAQTSPRPGAASEGSPTAEARGAVQATAAPGQAEDASLSSYRSSWAPSTTGLSNAAVGSSTIRGFEPVPPVRAPLAESLSGGLMAVPDLGGRTLSRGTRPPPRAGANPRGDTKARWMLLCAVAFATVGVVSFGGRLLNRYRNTTERTRALAALETASPASRGGDAPGSDGTVRDARDAEDLGASGAASRALLANRPAFERGSSAGRTTVVSASGSSDVSNGRASAVSVSGAAPNAAGTPEVASQESQLAATAARHMLAGSYAEALPVYRQLAREWPENSSYAAMARLLEKRVGTVNDTKTIAPAAP